MKKKVLIVEDEFIISLSLKEMAESCDFEVIGRVASGEEALELVERGKPDVIIMDIVLKGKLNGIQTANRINSKYDIPFIFISGTPGINMVHMIKGSKPIELLKKPVDINSLRSNLRKALET